MREAIRGTKRATGKGRSASYRMISPLPGVYFNPPFSYHDDTPKRFGSEAFRVSRARNEYPWQRAAAASS